jgi:hypothetical protein
MGSQQPGESDSSDRRPPSGQGDPSDNHDGTDSDSDGRNKPTDQQTSTGPTTDSEGGKRNSSASNAAQGDSAESDTQSQDSEQGKSDGTSKKSGSQPSNSKTATPQSPSNSGQASSGEEGEQADTATGDDANLEYARKATDLVLEYLRDQKQQADPELLDKLGWKQEDVERFLRRWDQMKRNASGSDPVSEQGKTKLDEMLKGMGLQPPTAETRRATDKHDAQRDNRNTGRKRTVPADLLDPFRAFQRGLQRRQ